MIKKEDKISIFEEKLTKFFNLDILSKKEKIEFRIMDNSRTSSCSR